MCGRYTLDAVEELNERYGLERKETTRLKPNFNVAPTQSMPVITRNNGKHDLELMRWGIPRFIGPGKVKDVFNTRADKAFWSWKKLTMSQRILIPATGFYEWKKQAGGKQPFFIHPKAQRIFSFAGIWNIWKDDEGKQFKTYSIMTTDPNEEMLDIHNRMPVILHPQDEDAWLSEENDNNQEVLSEFLLPYDDNGLEMYEVSKDVNIAKTNEQRLMLPLNSR
jgi:putative SOS response-associated peptidase YedK